MVFGCFLHRACYVIAMPTIRLSKRTVDSAVPAARDQFLWDCSRKGFGLKVTPAGRRIYILQYRMGGRATPTRRYKIGQHGSGWTPELAGKEAERLLVLVSQGIDPAEEKISKRYVSTELTFDAVADKFEKIAFTTGRDRYREFVKSTLRKHLRPKLGKRSLPSVKGADIVAILDDIPSESIALRRNVYGVARRLMRWAKGRGMIEKNPLEGFDVPAAARSRDRVLQDNELKLIWVGSENIGTAFTGLVRLLLLTGQRREEVAALDWCELDRGKTEWLLPAARAKNGREHLIPLSKQVVAELDRVAGGSKWPSRGYVLTTDGGESRVSGFSKCKAKLDEQVEILLDDDAAPVRPWRFHDLRRSAATGLQALRIPGDWIEAVQNRCKGGVAGVYQRYAFADEKREALDAWGAHVANITANALAVRAKQPE